MTNPLSESVLTIFWGGDELPGIICYGYWPAADEPEVPFPTELWPPSTAHADSWFRNWQEGDRDWRVLRRDILLHQWPAGNDWLECVRVSLESIRGAGACVAWCATEGCFADPPEAFDPEGMQGGVWAVSGTDLGFSCTARPGEPYEPVAEATLISLQAAALRC